jgi:hypothetical protein
MLASTGSNPERRRYLTTRGGPVPDEYVLRLEASGEVTPAPDADPPAPEEAEE